MYTGARNPDAVDLPGAKVVALDITDPASVASAAEIAGDVTLLINNAGSSTGTDLLNGDEAQIRIEMETHFFGTLSVIRAFAPKISTNGGGSILNILPCSRGSASPGVGAYCAAKSAEWSMTNSLRVQLAEQNIRVAGLHVGYMDTDMTASITAPKSNPADIAKIAIDGVEQDLFEIVADDVTVRSRPHLLAAFPPCIRSSKQIRASRLITSSFGFGTRRMTRHRTHAPASSARTRRSLARRVTYRPTSRTGIKTRKDTHRQSAPSAIADFGWPAREQGLW